MRLVGLRLTSRHCFPRQGASQYGNGRGVAETDTRDWRHLRFSCAMEHVARLQPVLRAALQAVASAYHERTGGELEVTSAWRSLRHCAALMAGFSREQLEGMYCRHGYPDYIRALVALRERQGAVLSEEDAYRILCERREGYISRHLTGGAVDIARPAPSQVPLLLALLTQHGFQTLDEEVFGLSCIHASHDDVPPAIVRE